MRTCVFLLLFGIVLRCFGQSQTAEKPLGKLAAPSKAAQKKERESLRQTLMELHAKEPNIVDRALAKFGVDTHQLIQAKSSSTIWRMPDIQTVVLRALLGTSPPQAILNGVLIPTVNSANIGPPISEEDTKRVVSISASVGRLETSSADSSVLGTAFVIGSHTIATNCHVLTNRIGALVDPSELILEFASEPSRSVSREFAVRKIYPCPGRLGFDVAFLDVAPMSLDGSMNLPKPLSIATSQPPDGALNRKPIWLLGYPVLKYTTEPTYQQLEASAPGKYALIFTPGLSEGVDGVNATSGNPKFQVILEFASSDSGNSGSPLIDATSGAVIGVHHCCYSSIVSAPSNRPGLPCSWVYGRSNYNEAIPMWEVAADPILGPILQTVTQAP